MNLSEWSEDEKLWSTPLASGVRQTQQAIEEITSLDYNRFTRSVLLAQGGFSFSTRKLKERSGTS